MLFDGAGLGQRRSGEGSKDPALLGQTTVEGQALKMHVSCFGVKKLMSVQGKLTEEVADLGLNTDLEKSKALVRFHPSELMDTVRALAGVLTAVGIKPGQGSLRVFLVNGQARPSATSTATAAGSSLRQQCHGLLALGYTPDTLEDMHCTHGPI